MDETLDMTIGECWALALYAIAQADLKVFATSSEWAAWSRDLARAVRDDQRAEVETLCRLVVFPEQVLDRLRACGRRLDVVEGLRVWPLRNIPTAADLNLLDQAEG